MGVGLGMGMLALGVEGRNLCLVMAMATSSSSLLLALAMMRHFWPGQAFKDSTAPLFKRLSLKRGKKKNEIIHRTQKRRAEVRGKDDWAKIQNKSVQIAFR